MINRHFLKTNRNAFDMSCGGNHTFLRTAAGEVYATGQNTNGQLGLNDTTSRKVFTKVTGIPLIADMSCGGNHTFLRTTAGEVYAAGYNAQGQLGLNNTTDRLVFVGVTIPK